MIVAISPTLQSCCTPKERIVILETISHQRSLEFPKMTTVWAHNLQSSITAGSKDQDTLEIHLNSMSIPVECMVGARVNITLSCRANLNAIGLWKLQLSFAALVLYDGLNPP